VIVLLFVNSAIAKKKILCRKHKIADDFLSRALGLMFSSRKDFDYALIFDLGRTTLVGAGIHMFFVFYSINVLFLDNSRRVVDIKKNLKPFRMYSPKKPARYIIELPVELPLSGIVVGKRLDWR